MGGWRKSLPADLILLTFSPPPRHPPHPPALPPSSSERWTALYPVSTEPPFPNKRIINGAFLGAGLSCTITPAPAPILPRFFFFFFSYRWAQRKGAMSYPHSTWQQQNNIRSPSANTIFQLPGKLSNTCFLFWRSRKYAPAARRITRAWINGKM